MGAVVVLEAAVVVVDPDMPALDGVRGGSGSCKRREEVVVLGEVGVSSMKTPESNESDMYKSALYT
jgi:hypothetical protein